MDTLIEKIKYFENTFAEIHTNAAKCDYGTLYYNAQNPFSWDSNHAIIYDASKIEEAVNDIVEFYFKKNLTPRIYTFANNKDTIGEYLRNAGFNSRNIENIYMVQYHPKKIEVQASLSFKRILEISNDIQNFLLKHDNPGEWHSKVLIESVRNDNFFLFGGFDNNEIVTLGSIHSNKSVSRIDHVFTHPDERNLGYGSQLMNYFTDFNQKHLKTIVYLYTNNPLAISVYQKAGFEKEFSLISGNYWK
jgi:GNAT superfamily N-acetyltransferase